MTSTACSTAQLHQAPAGTPSASLAPAAAADIGRAPAACSNRRASDAAAGTSIRRVYSSPTFKGLQHSHGSAVAAGAAGDAGLEVYVVARAFTDWGGPVLQRMPPGIRTSLVDVGVCHYMTVFKTPSGELVQFDFGPRGGDVQKAAPRALRALLARPQRASIDNGGASSGGRLTSSGSGMGCGHALPVASLQLNGVAGGGGCATLGGMMAQGTMEAGLDGAMSRPPALLPGEVRERMLTELPAAHLYVGRCSLTIDDIRSWNDTLGTREYRLHTNDCRHYVNSLVKYATGVEGSCQHLKRHHFRSRHAGRFLWHGLLVEAGQLLTDVGNWHRFQMGTAAAALLVTGRSTLAHIKPLLLPLSPLLASAPSVLPAARAQLLKRPLASGAVAAVSGGAAVATLAPEKRRVFEAQRQSIGVAMQRAALALRRATLGRRAEGAVSGPAAVAADDASGTGAAAAVARAGGLGGHVGRHVMWLSSSAARTTSAFANAAGRRMGALLAHRHAHGVSGDGVFGKGADAEFMLSVAEGARVSRLGSGQGPSVGSGRQVLRLPAPRLAWVRSRASTALVMQ